MLHIISALALVVGWALSVTVIAGSPVRDSSALCLLALVSIALVTGLGVIWESAKWHHRRWLRRNNWT